MKFNIKNIGKIGQADIEINGITVIAGENDTGKSTIGKALFALFNSLYQIDKFVMAEKIATLSYIIEEYCHRHQKNNEEVSVDFFGKQQRDKVKQIPYHKLAAGLLELDNNSAEQIKEYLIKAFLDYDAEIEQYLDLSAIEQNVLKLEKRLQISDAESVGIMVKRVLNEEFSGQFRNLNAEGNSEIMLQIAKKQMHFISDKQQNIKVLDSVLVLKTPLAYIDDPFVLDDIDKEAYYQARTRKKYTHVDQHTEHLKSLLLKKSFPNAIEQVIINEKLETIYQKINQVSSGSVISENSELIYKDNDNSFRLSNLSTGLKAFVIMKMLLLNGVIEEKAIVILDEPEIHLHPEWQLIFAETIVLMQKEFNLHILLNTHSPYFLEAIELYAQKYQVADKCKYYLSKKEENGKSYTVEDVTTETEKIYQLLAKAFQTLENEI